jgi:hypothetical protein
MTFAPTHLPGVQRASLLLSPWLWIGLFVLVVLVALGLAFRLPLGANYWDTAIYLDAAQRIRVGQVPSVDFAAPVGALGYYLAAGGFWLFPRAPAMLVVQWCILLVTLPLLALLAGHVARASRLNALALTLPFLLFSLFPMNLHDFYPLPGFDGYGYYNRHVSLLLYLLVATLLFVESRVLVTGLMAALMLALFMTKVTGAVAGSLIIGYALLARRVALRDVCLAAAIVLAVLGLIEAASGMISGYLGTILFLLKMNNDTLLRRILTVASVKFNVVGPSLLLAGVLLVAAFRGTGGAGGKLPGLVRSPAGMFVAVLAALAVFETQNTGSLEFFGLWPVLVLILNEWRGRIDTMKRLVIVCAAAVALPSAIIYVERSARAILSAPSYMALDAPDLRGLGHVLAKPDIARRGAAMLDHYAKYPAPYAELAARDMLPSYILFSEFDFQVTWLLSVQEAVTALKAYEAANNIRFASLYTLDFTDPFNWLLDRRPPKFVQIGLDPGRTTQAPDDRLFAELNTIDALLVPLCPITSSRIAIADTFGTDLEKRRTVRLSRCWEMRLKG